MDYVLYEVFSYLPIHEQCVMARVSKLWFQSAISRLYKDVDISEAVAPLGKLVLGSDGYFHFLKPIMNLSRFQRFVTYAQYVQILNADERYERIIDTLAEWSKQLGKDASRYPFPRLRSLTYVAASNKGSWNISPLVPDNLDHLSLTVPDLSPAYYKTITSVLTTNCKHLYFLAIDLRDNMPTAVQCIPILERLLDRFKGTLTCVQIPEVFMTPSVAARLAGMNNLCDLAVGMPDAGFNDPRITRQYAGANGRGKFNALRRLSYYGLSSLLYDAFLFRHNLTSVTSFHWDFDVELQPDLGSFIASINRFFPFLTDLCLGNSEMYDSGEVDIPLFQWSSVRPVLACGYLTELALHPVRVAMTDQALLELLRNRPSWKRIELYTEEPYGFREMQLFARHCPNLTHLGLHFDPTYKEDSLSHRIVHSASFQHLVSIDFAYSMFPSGCETLIGKFFFDICANPPRIEGWQKETWNAVVESIADCYVEEETRTGRRMSLEARDYVDNVQDRKLMEVDSRSGRDSSEEGDEEYGDEDDEMVTDD